VITHQVHAVPGRLRVRIPGLKENPRFADALRARLHQAEGVVHVDTRPLTGSVIIQYDSGLLSHACLLGYLRQSGCLISAHAPGKAGTAKNFKRPVRLPNYDRDALARKLAWMIVEKAVEHSFAIALAALL
jgi:hypothetical protein